MKHMGTVIVPPLIVRLRLPYTKKDRLEMFITTQLRIIQ